MKLKSTLVVGAAMLAGVPLAHSQTVINITGATAFRSASNNTILQLLGGAGVAEYAYTGTQGLSGSNRVVFKGNINSQPYIIRTSWSGSLAGIKDVVDGNEIQFLKSTVTVSATGVNNPGATEDFENAKPRWSFSDVHFSLSERPSASLLGGPVGVVPFMFVGGEGLPSGITNVTDQQHNTLWATGFFPASVISGNAADTLTIYATGRNASSGTRATVLSETGYGSSTDVVQFNGTFTGDRLTGTLTGQPTLFQSGGEPAPNAGHSSNSNIRDLLTRPGTGFAFISYLTVSDAIAATGYDPATGNVTGGEGAIPLTYNGARYSPENVKNGAYTLWGYQQLYLADDATDPEKAFDTLLRGAIPANMGSAGIPIPDMKVERLGGDGGPVVPLD